MHASKYLAKRQPAQFVKVSPDICAERISIPYGKQAGARSAPEQVCEIRPDDLGLQSGLPAYGNLFFTVYGIFISQR